MRTRRLFEIGAVTLVAALSVGAGCPLIPEINEKIIQIAVGASTSAIFDTQGRLNQHDDTQVVDIRQEIDLATVLDDAGVDISRVENIKLSGVSYRTITPDTNPDREIVDGNVTVQRGSGPVENLVVNFDSGPVNAITTYRTAPLDAAGVAVLNQALSDLLQELRDGTPAGNLVFTFHVTGISNPQGIGTNFTYELKVDFSILGEVTVDVVE